MNTLRIIYNELPGVIEIPEELRHKKSELLIISLEEGNKKKLFSLDELYGSISDFPERSEYC